MLGQNVFEQSVTLRWTKLWGNCGHELRGKANVSDFQMFGNQLAIPFLFLIIRQKVFIYRQLLIEQKKVKSN